MFREKVKAPSLEGYVSEFSEIFKRLTELKPPLDVRLTVDVAIAILRERSEDRRAGIGLKRESNPRVEKRKVAYCLRCEAETEHLRTPFGWRCTKCDYWYPAPLPSPTTAK